jgi:hypothetical protein
MRFKDLSEVEKRATELSKIVVAWYTMMASGGKAVGRAPKPEGPARRKA